MPARDDRQVMRSLSIPLATSSSPAETPIQPSTGLGVEAPQLRIRFRFTPVRDEM